MKENSDNKVPIFGISRLRMGIDGPGITTLVTFMGCPLHCKYCLNDICHFSIYKEDGITLIDGVKLLSPLQLYETVKIDNLCFQTTDGGICFGGGEPTLQANFINAFRTICGNKWRLTIETCLHCSEKTIKELACVVDYWIVDIKSLQASTYKSYTAVEIGGLAKKLNMLLKIVGPDRVTIKIPIIPDFNNQTIVTQSADYIKEMGFKHIEKIKYYKTSKSK